MVETIEKHSINKILQQCVYYRPPVTEIIQTVHRLYKEAVICEYNINIMYTLCNKSQN